MIKSQITHSAKETQRAGEDFAREILAGKPQKNAVVLALSGDLGAGKTTFLQGFARGLGIQEVVNSPTFVIMKKFKILGSPTPHHFEYFYHIDCYRLESQEDMLQLGFAEIISWDEGIFFSQLMDYEGLICFISRE